MGENDMARIWFVVLVLTFVSVDRSAGAAESQEAPLMEDSIAIVEATKEASDLAPLRVAGLGSRRAQTPPQGG